MVGGGNSNHAIMTQNDSENVTESENSSYRARVQSGFKPYRYRLNKWIQRRMGRKPAYMVTRGGIEVHYFNFADTDTLPFDLETYRNTQIFMGNWANPWYVDVDGITEEYDNFAECEINDSSDIFGTEYVYPSQKWKTLANQKALAEMFTGRSINTDQLRKLLYVVIGGLVLIGLIVALGGG